MKRRILHLLIALDQLAWVLITLGHGHPDETLSAAAWRLERKGRWQGRISRPAIDMLALGLTLGRDKGHCRKAFLSELLRSQLHPDYSRGR